jgi:hypothetical protein
MLLNQETPTPISDVPPADGEEGISPVVEVVAGWDPTNDDSDVIVACRTASGDWYLAGTTAPVSSAQVERLTGQTPPPAQPLRSESTPSTPAMGRSE